MYGGSGGALIDTLLLTCAVSSMAVYEYWCPFAAEDDDVVEWFERVAEDAGVAQAETLRRILVANLGAEYLQRWLGALPADVGDMSARELEALFVSAVPLASHADFEPYIRRIAAGDAAPLLTRRPITMLSLSSGTTDGRPKYVPFTRFSSQSTLYIFRLAAAYRSRIFPIKSGGRILEFIYSSKQFRTAGGGLLAGTATSHYFASDEFLKKQSATKCFTCSPYEVIAGDDYHQSTYCHLLFGLLHRHDVEFVASTFAYSLVQAFAAFEAAWEELCSDIEQGNLSVKITSPEMRKAVTEHLRRPEPALASEIRKKCEKLKGSSWFGVIPELWPNAKYVYAIMTGSMMPYTKKLKHYAGGEAVPLVSAEYGSTESWIGANLEPLSPPEKVTFTVIPTFAYFEFIPVLRERDKNAILEAEQPVPLSGVVVGQQDEIVLTTFTGLYRYRLGDVVEVAGFHKGLPRLSFVCRKNLILTVNIDKNTERDLQAAVETAAGLLAETAAELVDFTSHANIAAGGEFSGHYVVYWELKGEAAEEVLKECCAAMDAAFADEGYVVSRSTRSIGPLELRLVSAGTFQQIMEHFVGNGAAVSQFKTPRCTANEAVLRLLDRRTVRRFWSTAYG
ncbi:indole-3-acetic acid-amido synthetase GH3.10-like [Zingiber officinale]|uniref:Uncharacterized protein n=1 Tax=Zingiber officinale TaxID=94328 RepID=A0A8J5F1I9_ZINOF|nr:indole-3-acetic acid-amido synthetase GH3.10-like [Zingiber officinale]KAG6478785.1 hypothetical protein ZIOFF_062229 [Zingiber officinale]